MNNRQHTAKLVQAGEGGRPAATLLCGPMNAILSAPLAANQILPGLVSILPVNLRTALPHTLFQNPFISLIMVELKPGQRLHFAQPAMRLLTVLQGQVRMHGPNGSFILHNFGHVRLEFGEQWKICAQTDASLSFFVTTMTSKHNPRATDR